MRTGFVMCAAWLTLTWAASVAGAQQVRACGVERWPVKVGIDDDVARVDTTPERTTVAALAALPRPYAVAQRERSAPYELKTYVVTARVVDLFREDDSDWHVVLADTSAAAASSTIIAELPAADCALGSRYASRFAALAPVMDSVRPGAIVEVTGLGFFDVPHGQRGVAPNAFELHPVTGFGVRKQGAGVVTRGTVATDTVWVNSRSHVYHCAGSRWYGRTSRGYFTTERQAAADGARPAYGHACATYP